MLTDTRDGASSPLEEHLRTALAARASGGLGGPLAGQPMKTTSPPKGVRRRALAGAVAVVMAAAVAVAVAALPDGSAGLDTSDVASPPGESPGAVPGEVPRFLIDGTSFAITPDQHGFLPQTERTSLVEQEFGTPGRLDGPRLFLSTVHDHPRDDFGLLGPHEDLSVTPVVLLGKPGHAFESPWASRVIQYSVDLGDGRALYGSSIGLPLDEVVAFVDGLVEREHGWNATALPVGLAEVPIAPLPVDGAYYCGQIVGDPAVSTEVCLYQDGFGSRFADRVSSSVAPIEQITVTGLPGAVGQYSEHDFWVMYEPQPGRALELRISGEGVTRAVVHDLVARARLVDEATWAETIAPQA